MSDRYLDFEELRPTGEASQVPDEGLSECGNDDPRRQRVATSTGGYPDEPTETDGRCRSCGASTPASQTKCRFCLTHHLGNESASTNGTAAAATLFGVVHLLVEALTFYGAVAKGAAAATLLTKADRDPVVDDCQLIYDLDAAPATQLTDKWPSLPEAIRVTSECGEQLLAVARERTGRTESTQSPNEEAHTTFLYDEGGHNVCVESRLRGLLERAESDIWLVPAIALQRSVGGEHSENRQPSVPSSARLECRKCSRKTEHQFQEFESIPDGEWSGQPMWECQVCQSPRHGPNPQ